MLSLKRGNGGKIMYEYIPKETKPLTSYDVQICHTLVPKISDNVHKNYDMWYLEYKPILNIMFNDFISHLNANMISNEYIISFNHKTLKKDFYKWCYKSSLTSLKNFSRLGQYH